MTTGTSERLPGRRGLLLDHRWVMRQGLTRMLERSGSSWEVIEAGNGAEALEAPGLCSCDLLLAEDRLPDMDAIDLLRRLRSASPGLPVLLYGPSEDGEVPIRCLRAGAAGYVGSAAPPAEWLEALRCVLEGGHYVSSCLAETLAGLLDRDPERARHEALSEREFEVMRLIASGRTVGEIADLLALSPKTVSTYRFRLLRKLCLQNNAQVTLYAVRSGLAHHD